MKKFLPFYFVTVLSFTAPYVYFQIKRAAFTHPVKLPHRHNPGVTCGMCAVMEVRNKH